MAPIVPSTAVAPTLPEKDGCLVAGMDYIAKPPPLRFGQRQFDGLL
jgi:hypothetical protein